MRAGAGELLERRRRSFGRAPTARAVSRGAGVACRRPREVDEEHPAGEPVDLVGRRPHREARLAGSAGPDQREEAYVAVDEAVADGRTSVVATEERGRLGRQVVRPRSSVDSGGKSRGQAGMRELEHALRAAQILQTVLAEVAQAARRRAATSPTSDAATPTAGPGRRGPRP